jgi:hypothetical protein
MIGLLMRTPSPQRGEGWGEGALTVRLYPLTDAAGSTSALAMGD